MNYSSSRKILIGISLMVPLFFHNPVAASADIAAQKTINGEANPDYDPDYAEHKAWLEKIAPSVKSVSQKYGIYGSVQMAQAVLESGWGQSVLSTKANNFFGIKGLGDNGSVLAQTWEYNGQYDPTWDYQEPSGTSVNGNKITGTLVKIPYGESAYVYAEFAKYKSFASSLDYNGDLLRNGLSWSATYYSGAWRENADTYVQAAQALQGKYATDNTYASKLISLIKDYGMDKMVDDRFLDVSSSNGFYNAINWLAQTGITVGYSVANGREYRPNQPVLREEMARFLYAYAGSPAYTITATDKSKFKDITEKSNFAKEIYWLASQKITVGDNGNFLPKETVTRGQMARFLYVFAGSPVFTPTTTQKKQFSDVNANTQFAKEIYWLAAQHVTVGNKGKFQPRNNVTRGQMAQFLKAFNDNVKAVANSSE